MTRHDWTGMEPREMRARLSKEIDFWKAKVEMHGRFLRCNIGMAPDAELKAHTRKLNYALNRMNAAKTKRAAFLLLT